MIALLAAAAAALAAALPSGYSPQNHAGGPGNAAGNAGAIPATVATPIGPGARYRPSAGGPLETCSRPAPYAAHLELFANRRAIVVPAGIGGCADAARTRTPTGIVGLARRGLLLGDLFRIWGKPLGPDRMLSFRGPVHAYVGGRPVEGPVSEVPLAPGTQVVIELGGYVPPHASFLFPRSLP